MHLIHPMVTMPHQGCDDVRHSSDTTSHSLGTAHHGRDVARHGRDAGHCKPSTGRRE